MTTDHFIYDQVELPADKVDEDGFSNPVPGATRQWSANDANRVFQGLRDIQSDQVGRTFNVRAFGAEVDGTTDDSAALLAALTAASATVASGFGAVVEIPKGTLVTSAQVVIPNGVCLRGAAGATPASIIKAHASFSGTSLVTNTNHTGGQEYAFLERLIIDGNKGNGAVCSVAVVDWVSLFVNSYIRDCLIHEGSNVGLRVAAEGTPGGMGPVLIENCWVARNTGHNVLVEDTAGNTGSATGIVFMTLTSENQGTNSAAVYLKGAGRLAGVKFIGTTHIEMGSAATGRIGIKVDGCSHSGFENVQLFADPATVSFGIDITNVVQNVGLKFEHVFNPNVITTVLRDQKNSVTLGAVNVNSYVTGDWAYQGAPRFLPVAGGKSAVFQSSAGVDRAWFDANGELTGASLNGAGIDLVGDATNNRPLTFVPDAASPFSSVYGFSYPSGGAGVLRFTSITGAKDVWQIGTDGTMFVYQPSTFQFLMTLQSGLKGPGARAAAPSSGAHVVGEIYFNADPIATGFIGWVCVTAGTPGTWKSWGVISV